MTRAYLFRCLALGSLLLALCSQPGCACSYYHKTATGAVLVRITLGTDQILGPFELNPDGSLKLGATTTTQSDTASSVAAATAHALKPSLLP